MKNATHSARPGRSIVVSGSVKLTDRSSLAMKMYLQELNSDPKCHPMTPEEESRMFAEYKLTGDKRIRDRIITSNTLFVITAVKKYQVHEMRFVNEKARIEDMVSEGNLGLVQAFDNFDPTRGLRFLTYAVWLIRQQATHYLNEVLPDIPQPANRYIIDQWIKRTMSKLLTDGIEEPSIEQVVDTYNEIKDHKAPVLTVNLLAKIREDKKVFVSASAPMMDQKGNSDYTFSEGGSVEERIAADPRTIPDFDVTRESTRDSLNKILSRLLKDDEREIVEYTYGLNGKEEKTLDQIAYMTGYTRERIGQKLKLAMKKLEERKRAFNCVF